MLSVFAAGKTNADGRSFAIYADPDLIETGFLKYLLPRFSLKTGIKVTVSDPADAHVALTATPASPTSARPALSGAGKTYYLELRTDQPANPNAERFDDWLMSEIGQRTITSFTVDGEQVFSGAAGVAGNAAAAVLPGNVIQGQTLSLEHCGRCHVVGEENRFKGIGSTPSFGLLRTFTDWKGRFEGFYALNPHPAFTEISGVTAPFDPERPPPIIPLRLTLDDLDNILAFVASIEPADLGAPIVHQ